jgi:DNA recombination protein RmuC
MEYLIIALLLLICVLLFWFLKKPAPNNQQALLELKELEHQKSLSWHKEQKALIEDELRDLRESFMW